MLKYEVQMMDGTPESITRSINLILAEFEAKISDPQYVLPLSVEEGFFNAYMITALNWIGLGCTEEIKNALSAVQEIAKDDLILSSPFGGIKNANSSSLSKRRFAAKLETINDLLNTFVHTNLESKTSMLLMGPDSNHQRLRGLLLSLLALDHAVSFETLQASITEGQEYLKEDLEVLMENGLLKEISMEPDPTLYELTPSAFYFIKKIKEIK